MHTRVHIHTKGIQSVQGVEIGGIMEKLIVMQIAVPAQDISIPIGMNIIPLAILIRVIWYVVEVVQFRLDIHLQLLVVVFV